MSGHIEYERVLPVFGAVGLSDLVEIGVVYVPDDAKPSELSRQMAEFYRAFAAHLDEQADELEASGG